MPEIQLVTKFAEELKKGKLMGTKCENCGARYLPPRAHCKCGSDDMEWFRASSRGKILAYASVESPPESMSKHASYIVAVAELEDGLRLLARLVGVTVNVLKAGMPVQVVGRRVNRERIVYELESI